MDTSQQQQLSNDSFSYGWLISMKPPFDFLGDSHRSDGGSFIEMDPHFLSMRWSTGDHAVDGAEFDFSLPWTSSLPSPLANADQIFHDSGHLLPFSAVSSPPRLDAAAAAAPVGKSVQRSSSKSLSSSSASSPAFHSAHSTPSSMSSSSASSRRIKSPLARNISGKSPRKLLFKYLRFLITLYKKIRSLKVAASKPEKSSNSKVSARSSPRSSSAFSSMEWCRSNADISISDAILYCKRSNDQEIK